MYVHKHGIGLQFLHVSQTKHKEKYDTAGSNFGRLYICFHPSIEYSKEINSRVITADLLSRDTQ